MNNATRFNRLVCIPLLLLASGCSQESDSQGEGRDAKNSSASSSSDGPKLGDVEVVKNIDPIVPSAQTSEQIIGLIKNASDATLTSIDPKIELAYGYGGIHPGVDKDGKYVFMFGTQKKNYAEHNMFFCHESTMKCKKVVDNTGEQHIGAPGVYIDGKIFIYTLDRTVDDKGGIFGSTLNYYDIETQEYKVRAKTILGLNGETRALALGTDKMLYLGGTSFDSVPHYASCAWVDPNDLTQSRYYSDYFTEAPVDRVRSIAADDTHIYQVVGDSPFYLLAIDKQAGTAVKLSESTDGKVRQLGEGVTFEYTKSGARVYQYLYAGSLQTEVSNLDDATVPWYDVNIHGADYWAQRSSYNLEDGVPKPTYAQQNIGNVFPDTDGVGRATFTAEGNGQEMVFNIEVDTYAQVTKEITTLESGKILVSGTAYLGLSLIDPQDDSANYLGARHVSISVLKEYYDYSSETNRVIMEGYPSMTTITYEPEAFFSDENLDSWGFLREAQDATCAPDCTEDNGMHRALDAVQIGETVYFASMAYRTGVAGGVVWFNTKTGEKGAVSLGVFDNYQTRSMIQIGGKLAIATQIVDATEYGGAPQPEEPKIFIFDPETKKVEKEYLPLEGLSAIDTGLIRSIDGRHIIGISTNKFGDGSDSVDKSYLYIVDTYTDEVVMQKVINIKNNLSINPSGSAQLANFEFLLHEDYIYSYLDSRSLIRIDKTGEIAALATLPVQGHIAISGGNMYFPLDEKVYKMPLPAP